MADQVGNRFDREKHEYSIRGVRVPSVSQLASRLQDFGSISAERLEFAADRGSKVHLACHLWDQGTLDEDALDPQLHGYVRAWKAFCRDNEPEWDPLWMEVPAYHEVLRFAGTPDRGGIIGGELAVVDIKAVAQLSPVTGVQLAGYKLLMSHNGFEPTRRIAVQLRPDGTYARRDFFKDIDCRAFLSLLTLHNWGSQK